MKSRKSIKLLLAVLSISLLLCSFFAFSSSAEGEAPVIASKNVSYEGAIHLYYAIPVTENVKADNTTLKIYDSNPETTDAPALLGVYSGEVEYIDMLGGSFIVIRTGGISPKDMAKYIYAQAESDGNKSEVCRYSVLEYLYERLYVSENTDDVQRELYNRTLSYGIAAQAALTNKGLSAGDAGYETPIDQYKYIYADKEIAAIEADGYNSGLYLTGDTLTLTYKGKDDFKAWAIKTITSSGESLATQTENRFTVGQGSAIITHSESSTPPEASSAQGFDGAFKDSAKENLTLTDSSKVYYNNSIYAERATTNNNAEMTFGVVADPADSTNRVLNIHKTNTDNATTYQSNLYVKPTAENSFNAIIFEADFYIDILDNSTANVYELQFRNGSDYAQRIMIGVDNVNTSVRLWSETANTGVTTAYIPTSSKAENTWYNIRIEYYIIDADKGITRTHVYFNDTLLIADNYTAKSTVYTDVNDVLIQTWGGMMCDFYMDNVIFEKVNKTYNEPAYTFDGSALPGDGQTWGVGLGSSNPGTATVADGKLTFVSPQSQGNDTIRVAPSAKYEAFGNETPINTWVFEADITATGTAAKLSNGTNSQLIFRDNSVGTQFAITLGLRHEEGGKLWFQSGSGSSASAVSGTPATNGEKFRLRLEYFINSDSKACIKVFINGTSYGTIVNATNVAHPEIDAINQFRLVIGSNDASTIVLDNVSFYNAAIAH